MLRTGAKPTAANPATGRSSSHSARLCAGNLREKPEFLFKSQCVQLSVLSYLLTESRWFSLVLFVLSNFSCVLPFHRVHFQLFQGTSLLIAAEKTVFPVWWKFLSIKE